MQTAQMLPALQASINDDDLFAIRGDIISDGLFFFWVGLFFLCIVVVVVSPMPSHISIVVEQTQHNTHSHPCMLFLSWW